MELSLFIAVSIVFAPPVHNDILTVSIIFKVIRSCFRLIVPLKKSNFGVAPGLKIQGCGAT